MILVGFGLTACSDDDSSDDTQSDDTEQTTAPIPLSEWVASFSQICEDTISEVEAAPMTDEEFDATLARFVSEVQALPPPDEMADTAADLIEAIGSSTDENLELEEQQRIEEEQIGPAMSSLGISEECIRGAQE